MTELESLIALNAIRGLGPIRLRRLLEQFASAQNVLKLSERDLVFHGRVPLMIAEQIRKVSATSQLQEEWRLIHKHNVKVMSFLDPDYPALLKEIHDAPVLLYIKGSIPPERRSVAMVGSRRATVYGVSMAEKLAMQMAEYGITVISGLARGIDTAAHRGTLRAKGQTVAVLGSGLANIYPADNKGLAEMIAQNGAVISEFPMAMQPLAYNFPQRNRIVSGLSLGVVVVEAANNSGALITAQTALEQGREVFALPGKVDCPNSAGTHELIKNGAKLTTGIEDILEELQPQMRQAISLTAPVSGPAEEIFLNSFEKEIYDCITNEPMHMDEIMLSLKKSPRELTALLLSLEMKGVIQQLPGHFFMRASKEGLLKNHV